MFLSVDPLAADYASWSPYNYVLGNPVRLLDPDGRSPDDVILDYNNDCECLSDFLDIANNQFPGQLNFSTEQVYDSNGDVIEGQVKLVVDKLTSSISSEANALFEAVNIGNTTDENTVIKLVSGDVDPNVATGNFDQSKIDVADLAQWPSFDNSQSEQSGATQAGKIGHEIFEQFSKQVFDQQKGSAHKAGLAVEDRINNNKRLPDGFWRVGGVQKFKSSKGVTTFSVIHEPVIKIIKE